METADHDVQLYPPKQFVYSTAKGTPRALGLDSAGRFLAILGGAMKSWVSRGVERPRTRLCKYYSRG